MRMDILKVTTQQGKLVIANPKNSTNNLFLLPLFNYILLYIIRGKKATNEYCQR